MKYQIPLDLERLPEFRRLVSAIARLGSVAHAPSVAVWLIHRLYGELGYLAQSGGVLGRMAASDIPVLVVAEAIYGVSPETLAQALMTAGLLRDDAPGQVACDRFVVDNPQFASTNVHERGWRTSQLRRAQRQSQAEDAQLSLVIPPDHLQDEQGVPIPPERIQRIMTLIRSVDAILQMPQRQPAQFGRGLVLDALRIIVSTPHEDVDRACRKLIVHRKHPRLHGYNTERLLAEWNELFRALG